LQNWADFSRLELYALIKWQMGILLQQRSGAFFDQRAICSFSVDAEFRLIFTKRALAILLKHIISPPITLLDP